MCYYAEIFNLSFFKYFTPRNTTIIFTLLAMNVSLVNLLEGFKSTYAKLMVFFAFASTHMRHVTAKTLQCQSKAELLK
jgi:hypothetical protein